MNDLVSLIRATLDSTEEVPLTMHGPSLRHLARLRQRRARVGGGALVTIAAVAVGAGVPRALNWSRSGPAGVPASAPASALASASPALVQTPPDDQASAAKEAGEEAQRRRAQASAARVFSDVIAGAFPMPGKTARQTIRVMRVASSIANVACGGSADPYLDSTAERFDQMRYADLELIKERGFVEAGAAVEIAQVGRVGVGACVDATMPSYRE